VSDTICPGSGQPATKFGGCDRCFAEDVRGEWVRTEPERFSAFPSFGYYRAKPHAPVVAPKPKPSR